eukprot:scaffold1074_cov409-Prasinococcus_capsulatus_cf.AAC.29
MPNRCRRPSRECPTCPLVRRADLHAVRASDEYSDKQRPYPSSALLAPGAYLQLHEVSKVVIALWTAHLSLVYVLPRVVSAKYVVNLFLLAQDDAPTQLPVHIIHVGARGAEEAESSVVLLVLDLQ